MRVIRASCWLVSDLEESERWLVRAFEHDPKPVELQLGYVEASRAEETRLHRSQLRGVLPGKPDLWFAANDYLVHCSLLMRFLRKVWLRCHRYGCWAWCLVFSV